MYCHSRCLDVRIVVGDVQCHVNPCSVASDLVVVWSAMLVLDLVAQGLASLVFWSAGTTMHRPGCPGKLIDKSCPLWPGVSGIGAVVIGGDWSADFDRGSTAVPKNAVLTLGLTH